MSRDSGKQPRERSDEDFGFYSIVGPLPLWQWALAWLAGVVPLLLAGYVAGALGVMADIPGGAAATALALGGGWTALIGFSIRDQHRDKRSRR